MRPKSKVGEERTAFKFKQEAHGPHRSPEKTVQINKHIYQLYHNVDEEKKKHINVLIYWFFI